MFTVARIATTMLTAGLVLATTGCAQPFPERLSWYGDHPYLYSMALGAAAEEAVVRSRTGVSYYEHLGNAAFTLSTTGTCDVASVEAYLTRKERGCHLLNGPPSPDCLTADACASFHYDRQLFSDPAIRRDVENALWRPCDFLTPPQSVAHRDATARFGMSASANWRILQCDGPKVFGTSVTFDDEAGIVKVTFARGDVSSL